MRSPALPCGWFLSIVVLQYRGYRDSTTTRLCITCTAVSDLPPRVPSKAAGHQSLSEAIFWQRKGRIPVFSSTLKWPAKEANSEPHLQSHIDHFCFLLKWKWEQSRLGWTSSSNRAVLTPNPLFLIPTEKQTPSRSILGILALCKN